MNQLPFALWRVGPVCDEPHTRLMNWRIFEVVLEEGGPNTLHVMGYAWQSQEGRVTSAISTMNLEKMIAKSQSGRLYALCGEPGYRAAAEFAWREWLVATGARVLGDVTQEFLDGARRLQPLTGPVS